jgi:biopolymer transport protein TolR
MASAGPTPANFGRRRNMDAEINLVPFIDLLSMCICFLLMTAIWAEVSAIGIKQLLGTEAAASTSKSYEITIRLHGPNSLTLDITNGGTKLNPIQVTGENFQVVLSRLGQTLSSFMMGLTVNDPQLTGRVVPQANIQYDQLVAVLDTLRGNGIVQLGVVPVREGAH